MFHKPNHTSERSSRSGFSYRRSNVLSAWLSVVPPLVYTHLTLFIIVQSLTLQSARGEENMTESTVSEERADSEGRRKVAKTEPVVVTATQTEEPLSQVGSSITAITREQITERQLPNVSELLRDVPGVDTVRSGGAGGDVGVFLRGSNSGQTLVLLDGIKMNDPNSPARAFNFSLIPTDGLESIEVLRGPQGTLYGSEAIGGVIQMFTKKGEGKPTASFSSELGSFDTYIERASVGGSDALLNYSLSASRTDTNGISAVADTTERDGHEKSGFSSRVGVTPSQFVELSLIAHLYQGHTQIDDGPGAGGDDPNRRFNLQQYGVKGQADTTLFDGVLKQIYSVSVGSTEFRDNDDPDTGSIDLLRSHYEGTTVKYSVLNSVEVCPVCSVQLGVDRVEERGSSEYRSLSSWGEYESIFPEQSLYTTGFYGQLQAQPFQDLYTTTGLRLDHGERYGDRVTWRFAPNYHFSSTGTRLKGSVGTGFKAPSLYQLFSEYGSEDLREEESFAVDGGLEQEIASIDSTVGVTYFYNDLNDLIDFDPNTFLYKNIDKARTQGIEGALTHRFSEALSIRGAYTFLDATDRETGADLLRKAKHRFSSTLTYKPVEAVDLMARVLVVGPRKDNDYSTFPAQTVSLSEYAVVDLGARYSLSKAWEVFARLENLLDKEYEEISGYASPGASAFGGVKYTFR